MYDYIDKTIAAYDDAPDKFITASAGMTNLEEMNIMFKHMPTGPILDVGCAGGKDTKLISDSGYEVIGIDLSNELLKRAIKKYPKLQFQHMDIRDLEFSASTFAAVWCNAVLLHLNDTDLSIAFKEIRRVLKPQGVVAFSFKEGEGQGEILENFTTDLARFYNFKTAKNLKESIEKAGFEVKESHILNEKQRFGEDKRDLNWVWVFAVKNMDTKKER